MARFTLSTHFTPADLERFYATGTNIVVAKPSMNGGQANVAWVVYRPLLENKMVWEEQYGIYASTSRVVNGAMLSQMSTTDFPAAEGRIYTLGPNGSFGSPSGGGARGTFTARNEYDNLSHQGFMTLGLYQEATVNGVTFSRNAVSAAEVLYMSEATMTPYTTLYIWTQSQVVSNTVVTRVTSVRTEVVFGGSATQASLQYNSETGGFVQIGARSRVDTSTGRLQVEGGEGLPEGIKLDYILPALAA